MEHEATVRIERPVSAVYNQWAQFESFPEFMQDVRSVTQLDGTTTEWDVEIAGVQRSFTADIIEQRSDSLIHWRSRTEPMHEGRVSFTPLGDATDVRLWMTFQPEGLVEQLGDKLGVVQGRVEGDLDRFKNFIEQRDPAVPSSVTHDVEGIRR